MIRAALLIALFSFVAACATAPVPPRANGVDPMSEDEYSSLISKHTRKTDRYSGFYQTFQAEMTILNTEVQTATLTQRAHFLQWDQKQFQAEREKVVQEATNSAKFFMRFFSPDNEYNDLHKGKTIWRVYLDYNGNRFEGKVRKMTEKFVEIQTLFPYFDRFSSPYEITFNVPMSSVEKGSSKVTLTSSLGTAEFIFPPAQ